MKFAEFTNFNKKVKKSIKTYVESNHVFTLGFEPLKIILWCLDYLIPSNVTFTSLAKLEILSSLKLFQRPSLSQKPTLETFAGKTLRVQENHRLIELDFHRLVSRDFRHDSFSRPHRRRSLNASIYDRIREFSVNERSSRWRDAAWMRRRQTVCFYVLKTTQSRIWRFFRIFN